MIKEYLDRNNLHHAYLIEGKREEIVPELFEFINSLGINTNANPDFVHMSLDSFKIKDARNLRSYAAEKSFSLGHSSSTDEVFAKKIFIISANHFLLEAQNSLLKMFEEPIKNTHFFLIVPDTNFFLKTLISRFYVISVRQDLAEETKDAEKFISMPLKSRIDFIKNLLIEPEEENEEGNEIVVLDSTRSKALKFLNALELVLHQKQLMSKMPFDISCFKHFFKVREFLRMPGSSVKTLMESVALVIPEK
ncbi:MAG: polymerase III delta prime subunit (HolB) protein [Candidatus Yanofskybacteria bacterium GW2011_GWC2_37_9]|uniref:Polymerase III delta prime subunit (HolB) protein n=2 Tax=Parcubacteria group TaxID=1794811 RepID=A0A0G0KES8_9BACT|nr:MAG: polymerase III delta prime subunit (HolB) protein [Candidatus Yanofskybacteria bacterium GW2011_GWC2_37_9]